MKIGIRMSKQNYGQTLLCLQMEIMYHYTNEKGYDAIQKHGYIAQSMYTGKDAAFGEGKFFEKANLGNKIG